MILLDTNVLIDILKGNQKCIDTVQSFNSALFVSSISVMELYYGARDKAELRMLEKFVSLFEMAHVSETISGHAVSLVKKYAKSHTLDIPDGLIASTALTCDYKLFTYNKKDFKYLPGIKMI